MDNINIKQLDNTVNYLEYCNILKQLTTIDTNNFTELQYNKQLELINNNPNHIVLIATKDNKIIGSLTLLVEPKFIHDLSSVGHIEDVVVDKEYRKSGIGKLLVDSAISYAKNKNCYKVILDCSESNLNFYQKCGFTKKEYQMVQYF